MGSALGDARFPIQAVMANLMIECCVLQVNQATKLKAKAGRLQEMAAELLGKAKNEKETAAALKAKYYKTMDDYGQAVAKIDEATQKAQSIRKLTPLS
jgi:hypothetical protein